MADGMVRSPAVTVVIPTHNRLELLKEAVASVRSQEFEDWELIIVDDHSTDGTWEWIETQMSDQVRAIRLQEHAERSVARNLGLADARSPYVLFLDDDDRLRPAALRLLALALDQAATAVASVGGLEFFDDAGNKRIGPQPSRRFTRNMWADAVRGWVVHSGRTLFRAAAVTEAGGFAPGLVVAEDRDLWLRVSRLGDATFIPDVVLEHRMHPAQWRPVGVDSIEIEVTRRHLAQLSAPERRTGERIIATRPYYQEARTAWAEGHAIGALRAYMKLARMPPTALFSPLFRPEWTSFFRRSLLGAVIGKRNVDRVRRLLSKRRDAGGAVEAWDPPFPKETGRPGSTHTISSE